MSEEIKQVQDEQQDQGHGQPRVFVYGTLKKGHGNHGLLENAEYLGDAEISGPVALIDLGWYPGVVRQPNGPDRTIRGEVYAVDTDTLYSLDILEGHPEFYERQKFATEFRNAWVYTLPPGYIEDDTDIIEEGVWNGSEG